MLHRLHALLMTLFVGVCFAQQPVIQDTDKSKRFVSSDGVLSLETTGLADKQLLPREKVVRPAITSVVYLEGDDKLKGAVVYTKIRPDYPQGDKLLDTQKPRFDSMQRAIGDDFKLEDSKNDQGRFLNYTFNGETYDKSVFPFGVTRTQGDDPPGSIGGHHFFVRNGYFFEIAVVLTTSTTDIDSRRKEVQAALDRIRNAMNTKPKDR